MAERWTIERARNLFKSRGCELLETEYVNDRTKMRYIATCGHEHLCSLNNFRRGKGDLCRACRIKDNARKESVSDEVMRGTFEREGCHVLTDYIATTTSPVRYIAQCGHENVTDYGHFFYQGAGRLCAKCSRSIRYEYDYVRECFEQEDCELLETKYINCKTPMRYIAKCGHESTITFDVFLNAPAAAKRCRACHKHTYHENPSDRNRTLSKVWRKAVYDKDGYSCVACGKHGGSLNAHHLDAYDANEEKRFDVSNGVTLCPVCHTRFHQAYGFGGNTKTQFQEWLQGIPRKDASQILADSVTRRR